MLIAIRASHEVAHMPIKIELVVIWLDGVGVHRHISSGLRFEPDDFCAACPATRDAPLVRFAGFGVLEAHISSRSS
jgi:hypothetical protein